MGAVMTIDFWLWAPNLSTYTTIVPGIRLPNGAAMARLPGEGETPPDGNALIYADGLTGSEIPNLVAEPGTYDENGDEITPPIIVSGYHANIRAHGALAEALTQGRPAQGTLFERTRLISLLDGQLPQRMAMQAKSGRLKAGYSGPSGIRIFDRPNTLFRAFG